MNILIKGLFVLACLQQPFLSFLLKSQEEVFNSVLTIKDLTLSQLKTNILYHLYVKLLNGLVKPKFILNSILLLPLTISKYKKVMNGKPHSHYTLANSNILSCPLAYAMAQASSKTILIMSYGITLMISALCTQITYLFTATTFLSTLSMFERSYSALGIQDFTLT